MTIRNWIWPLRATKRGVLIMVGVAAIALSGLAAPSVAQNKGASSPAAQDDDDEAPARPWGDAPAAPPSSDTGPDTVIREDLPQNLIDKEETHVERDALTPLGAVEDAPFPGSVWASSAPKELEALVGKVPVPLRSWALSRAWIRLLEADGSAASAEDRDLTLARARKLEAMGLFAPALKIIEPLGTAAGITPLRVRLEISQGHGKKGCDLLATERVATTELPPDAQVEAALLAGFCAALGGDVTQAGIAAGIARDLSGGRAPGADLLDAINTGTTPKLPKGHAVTPLEYRIIELKGAIDAETLLDQATPALLVALARSDSAPDDLRLPAAERAARLGLVGAADLAVSYRQPHPGGTADTIERAALYKRIEAEMTPLRKARLIRAFLDEAHRQDMHTAGYVLMMPQIQALTPAPELGWFAETAIEASLLSGRFDVAKRWAEAFAVNEMPKRGGSVGLWRALVEVAEPRALGVPRDVSSLAALAAPGAVTPELMRRLSTSLDALDVGIPQALWDARSNLPEPTTGYLPESGTLTSLKDASEKRELARTLLLAISALGPNGADGAHAIALGDCLRALKRAGFDAEARLIALEALLPLWPRIALE